MNEFGPTFFRGLIGPTGRLTCFCKGNSSTQSNPNQSTNINDSRVAASEGSISVGSGASANVSIQSGDVKVATDALQTAEVVGVNALEAARQISADVLDFRSRDTEAALQAVTDAQRDTSKLIASQNEKFVQALQSNAGDAPQETVKAIVTAGALAVAVIGAAMILKKK